MSVIAEMFLCDLQSRPMLLAWEIIALSHPYRGRTGLSYKVAERKKKRISLAYFLFKCLHVVGCAIKTKVLTLVMHVILSTT